MAGCSAVQRLGFAPYLPALLPFQVLWKRPWTAKRPPLLGAPRCLLEAAIDWPRSRAAWRVCLKVRRWHNERRRVRDPAFALFRTTITLFERLLAAFCTAEADTGAESAAKDSQQAATPAPAVAGPPVSDSQRPAQAPPPAAAAEGADQQATQAAAPAAQAQQQQQQKQPSTSAALAADLATAVRRTTSAQSLPDAQQRRKGTATNDKWAQYAGAASAEPRQRRRQRSVSAGETLHAAVRSTSRLRLLLAALLAVLLAARWDAAAVGSEAGLAGTSGTATDRAVSASQPVAVDGPRAALQARLQAAMQQTRAAAAAVLPFKLGSKMEQTQPAAAKSSDRRSSVLAGIASRLEGPLAAAAASPAGQKLAAALLVARRQLEAAATSPAGMKAAAALQAARRQLDAAAVSPAGQQASAAVQAARAALTSALQAACRQLAAVRASPLGRRAEAALARLPPAASLPALARAQLAAVAATPAGLRVLQLLDRLPPLASLLLLNLSLVGAAAAAMAAAPGLVHSTVRGGAGGTCSFDGRFAPMAVTAVPRGGDGLAAPCCLQRPSDLAPPGCGARAPVCRRAATWCYPVPPGCVHVISVF